MLKILLAYSDEDILGSLSTYLLINGFDVDKTKNSKDAVALLSGEKQYDLFICGQHLNPDNGIELCKNIRKRGEPDIRDIKTLLVTQEKPDFELSKKLLEYDIYNISLYRRFSIWLEKIDIILLGDKAKSGI